MCPWLEDVQVFIITLGGSRRDNVKKLQEDMQDLLLTVSIEPQVSALKVGIHVELMLLQCRLYATKGCSVGKFSCTGKMWNSITRGMKQQPTKRHPTNAQLVF